MKAIWTLLGSALAVLVAGLLVDSAANAQAWPTQNVRFITSGPSGSAPDLMARTFAAQLTKKWGQTVLVDNVPGAENTLAVQALLRAQDGHTLLLAPSGIVMIASVLRSDLPYDPKHDLVPISAVTTDYLAIVVPAVLGIASINTLISYAAAKPGFLNWHASPGAPYLTFLNFINRKGLDATYIPYRGASANAMTDLAAGTLHAGLVPLTPIRGLVADGKLRVLAITNRERASAYPAIPTVVEAGFPELTMEGVLGAFGGRGIPAELAARIAADFRSVSTDPELVQRLAAAGQVVRLSGPAEYKAYLGEQFDRWTSIARTSGIRPTK